MTNSNLIKYLEKNDNKLLNFFFGLDGDICRHVNNYTGDYHDIECREIYIQPLIDCINSMCNTKIKKARVIYNPYIFTLECSELYFKNNFKFYDKDNKKINIIDIIIHHEKFQYIRKKLNP